MVPNPTATMNQQSILTTQPSMSQDTDVTVVQVLSCDIDGWVVMMVCWFLVVVGFGTIVVAVVSGLGMNKMLSRIEPDQNLFPFSNHLGVSQSRHNCHYNGTKSNHNQEPANHHDHSTINVTRYRCDWSAGCILWHWWLSGHNGLLVHGCGWIWHHCSGSCA